jgi:hypothetical protein
MIRLPSNVYLQSVAVLATSELPQSTAPEALRADSSGRQIRRLDSSIAGPGSETSTQILRTTFSSVPVILQSELIQDYQELGEALNQMTELDEQNEWSIDPPVYRTACFIAAGLMVNSFKAPRIFTHGPKSVVFNWSRGASNLYLTISDDKVSALLSSPERIQRRIEFSVTDLLNPGRLLSTIQSAHLEQPTQLRLNGAVPDPSELVEKKLA